MNKETETQHGKEACTAIEDLRLGLCDSKAYAEAMCFDSLWCGVPSMSGTHPIAYTHTRIL